MIEFFFLVLFLLFSFRIVEVFSRRLQGKNIRRLVPRKFSHYSLFSVQERLTRQIAEAIAEAIEPRGVAVIVECV